jgi:hypothetical protein
VELVIIKKVFWIVVQMCVKGTVFSYITVALFITVEHNRVTCENCALGLSTYCNCNRVLSMIVRMDLLNTYFVLLQVSTDISQVHCILRIVRPNAVGWILPWSHFEFFSHYNVLAEGNFGCVNVKFYGCTSLIKLLFPPRMKLLSDYCRLFVWERVVSIVYSV